VPELKSYYSFWNTGSHPGKLLIMWRNGWRRSGRKGRRRRMKLEVFGYVCWCFVNARVRLQRYKAGAHLYVAQPREVRFDATVWMKRFQSVGLRCIWGSLGFCFFLLHMSVRALLIILPSWLGKFLRLQYLNSKSLGRKIFVMWLPLVLLYTL
jgi:hypothetical protein